MFERGFGAAEAEVSGVVTTSVQLPFDDMLHRNWFAFFLFGGGNDDENSNSTHKKTNSQS